ncbi:cell wall-binding repeat-containing protein [Bacillus sp. B15-48]|uniref:cell wall-binding repeat-containing protein n=1 Tax=Bacillus sp. B15-48 TaxID=1548601 RepID=UPI00193FF03A|nr:cell wall-binding repeat-containing protein [Bacillus sp. B15-48]MBM4760896.1 N-acetylmuramoyl-L-alanine amidase [Bacillus sp. B15-48]
MRKYSVALMIVLILFFTGANQSSADGYTSRLAGKDRFDVAVNVAKSGWSSADTVVIANYLAYADALAAAPLAYKHNAPILLTLPNDLSAATKNEIARLKAKSVIIVGGNGSVSEKVEKQLKDMGISSVERISGKDRFEVANNIATKMGRSSKVILTYGLNFPDALAIAPYAARNGFPILLTNTNTIPQSTKSLIQGWNVSQTIIVGGEGSVSRNVFNSVPKPYRIGGLDRFEVASNIANQFFSTQSEAFVATGMTFADALTGSVLAAKKNQPILLTSSSSIPNGTKNAILNNGYKGITILGGMGSVSNNIANQLKVLADGIVIMIDPGHGGSDPGASGHGLIEKELVLDISKRLALRLENSNYRVLMTRTGDTYPSLDDRIKMANESGANVFVSIHVNAFTSPSAHGTETYWNSTNSSTESKLLAEEIQKELVAALGTYNRGVKSGGFKVIRDTKIPSVLVEVAFISNPNDAKLLSEPAFRQKAADAIFKGITNYFNKF